MLVTVPEKKSRPVVLLSVKTSLVPVAMLDTMARIAITVAMFGTAFVVTVREAALVTALEMSGYGKMPTPTIITASCFRLHSQSYYKR